MDEDKFRKQVIGTIVNEDFLPALSKMADNINAWWPRLSDEQKVVMLKTISGLARHTLDTEFERTPSAKGERVHGCDFCARTLEYSEMIQGHNGRICKKCVELICVEL